MRSRPSRCCALSIERLPGTRAACEHVPSERSFAFSYQFIYGTAFPASLPCSRLRALAAVPFSVLAALPPAVPGLLLTWGGAVG